MKPEVIEQKLRNIIDGNKPKHIIIDGKKYYVSRPKIDEIKLKEQKEGGIIPLIPLIIGGVAAAGSIAGGAAGIAKAVDDKKAHDIRQKELERHNKELEKIAKGGELDNDRDNEHQEFVLQNVNDMIVAIDDFIDSIQDMTVYDREKMKESLQFIATVTDIYKQGNGLFLNPYRGSGVVKEAIDKFSNMQKQLSKKNKMYLKNTLNNLANHIKIESNGNGLFLNPR